MSRRSRKKDRQNFIPNGVTYSSVRLSIALWIFAGGDPLDIDLVHGVFPTEVNHITWRVVDAIHSEKSLNIIFHAKYEEQRRVANGFKAISTLGFDNCAGCIDGLIVWTLRSNENDTVTSEVGVKNFYFVRKGKFGLNLQGPCEANGKFLDISIGHPGSTSDYLAFVTSSLHTKVEKEGFFGTRVGFTWR